MHRLFIAVELPRPVRDHLRLLCHGLPDTRWVTPEQLHLTLHFIGELEGSLVLDVQEALATVEAPPFELMLMGVGHFPPRGKPTSVWTGADGGDGLLTLYHRVDRALQHAGLPPEGRKFMPHVTLGRLKGTPPKRVAGYMSQHAAFSIAPFDVTSFSLYKSHLTPNGANHRRLAQFALSDEEPL